MRIPTKRANLEYHEIIKQPIDLNKIQQKFKTDEYQMFQQFDSDIQLLISNAKLYHQVIFTQLINYYIYSIEIKKYKQKDTTEYKDTIELEEFYNEEKKKRLIEINSCQTKEEQQQDESLESEAEPVVEEIDQEIIETTVAKKRGRPSIKSSPAKLKETIGNGEEASVRSVRVKSINNEKETNLTLYLEDYFDTIVSFQDENLRILAQVFYELPSAKVSDN